MIDFELLQSWGMVDEARETAHWKAMEKLSNEELHNYIEFYEAYYAQNGENGPAEFKAEIALLILRERGEEVVIHAGW